jgi:hypothetical protein
VRINEAARLSALRASFLILGTFLLLAIFPTLGLPNYVPDDEPPEQPPQAKPKPRIRKKAPAK